MPSITSYLSIGSNIETSSSTRLNYLQACIRQLSQHESIKVVAASHVYETVPVGYENQEHFLNAAVEISTTLDPHELLRICLDVVEKRSGRKRNIQDGPRTLDVDILTYGDQTISSPDLTIPHPKMNERAFVIVPLAEIAPKLVGDISSYEFVDNIDGVVKLDEDFEDIIDSYREHF
jgi:2-amino-4-hydroxy-6-hydroxymethyldihydropteridine diphosphokinase